MADNPQKMDKETDAEIIRNFDGDELARRVKTSMENTKIYLTEAIAIMDNILKNAEESESQQEEVITK